jgi:HK97 family phage prohead protease
MTRALTPRSFSAGDHPRTPAGDDTGGQFTAGSAGKSPPPKKAPATKAAAPASGAMGFDPKTGKGTGYGVPGGDKRVQQLQGALNRLGLKDSDGKPLKVDGKLGPKTTAAVKAAQKRLGLRPDGRVTPALLKQLAGTKSLPERGAAMDLCVRSFDFETRGTSGDGRTMEGYAAVFNTPARIRDMQGDFDETILPGAFARSLEARRPVLQFEHGKDPRIGAAPIGSIAELREDDHGLYVRATLYDHPDIERVRLAIAGGSLRGMSFRFGVPDKGDTWTRRAGEPDLREIRDADVHELGPVVFPAYDATTVTVRSMLAQLDPDEHRALIRELAAELRLAVDLQDLVGKPEPERSDGEDRGSPPSSGDAPATPTLRQRLDEGALRIRGILS